MFASTIRSLLALALCLGLAACDSVPGPSDPDGRSPVLSDFSFSPEAVVFEDLPPDQVLNDTLAQVPITIDVRATDPDADVDSVFYVIQAPFDPFRPVKTGPMTLGANDRYRASFRLGMPKGGAGLYAITVYAVDRERRLSNRMRGLMPFEVLGGSPPVIERIDAPDTFQPPGTLTLVAVVSDPDGLSNIRRVVVRAPNGAEFQMFDDGESQGDARAGDGRYTASFDVPSATPGAQTFAFQAFDRSNLASEVVTKTITVVP